MSRFDHFNLIGPIYDRIFGRGSVDPLLEKAQLHPEVIALDLGGGTGRVSSAIKPLVRAVHVADCAGGMLREAVTKGLDVVLTCSEKLPYLDLSIDRIIMVDAFHHLANQQQTMQEMWRVLAPGGLILIEEPDIANPWVKLIALGEKILLMRSHFRRPAVIAKMGELSDEASITVEKSRGIAWVIIRKLAKARGDLDVGD